MFLDNCWIISFALLAYLNYCVAVVSNRDEIVYIARHNHESRPKCEPITVPFCQNIEYNQTTMPNILRHQNQKEVTLAVHQYYPALKVKCSVDVQFFLCSLYVPICTIMDEPLQPCRSLCLSVRKGCESILNSFGHPWPNDLNCDRFPDDSLGNVLCVSKNQTGTNISVSNGQNNRDIVPRTSFESEIQERVPFRESEFLPGVYKEFTFVCPDHIRVPKGYEDSFNVGNVTAKNCGLPCDGIFFTEEERQFSRIWIGTWSLVCAISCLFTVLTFMLNTSRFRYPERPIIFLSVCYLIISVIYVLGFLSGDRIACRKPFPPPNTWQRLQTVSTISQGTKGELCTIMFIGLYFFSMTSSIWWVILALTWVLAAGLKWGHEAIEANSQYFHLAAWAIPALKTITILALGKIEGDILTGVCFVGLWNPDMMRTFVLVPLAVYLVFGTIFLLLGFVSLFRIRTAMKHDRTKTDKLEKLMLRIGVFSVLYMVPATMVLVCLFYEQANFDRWMVSWHWRICQTSETNPYLIRCPSDGEPNLKPNFLVFMLKYLSSLIIGITSSVWIWSNKTVASWRELFYKFRRKRQVQV